MFLLSANVAGISAETILSIRQISNVMPNMTGFKSISAVRTAGSESMFTV